MNSLLCTKSTFFSTAFKMTINRLKKRGRSYKNDAFYFSSLARRRRAQRASSRNLKLRRKVFLIKNSRQKVLQQTNNISKFFKLNVLTRTHSKYVQFLYLSVLLIKCRVLSRLKGKIMILIFFLRIM